MSAPAHGRNRLARETSPYLLQHADNPVDWYPWGEEAFAAAREAHKPLLISIGYSSCHWCHVMEHESFEDRETAKLMNESFVCVKVDREERPDVDEIYMTALQMMGLGGGWPLNAFVTPEGVPFYGGTYFPPETGYGRPSWKEVLLHVATAWRERPDAIADQERDVRKALQGLSRVADDGSVPAESVLERATKEMLDRFDPKYGGFRGSPKFPPVGSLQLALTWHARHGNDELLRFVERTLQRMADGGIHDQLGGGFHRYSTDEKWLVPHFEKMLYDNAALARVYVEAFQVTGSEEYARIARDTLDYVLREMTERSGAFRSATDADSDGREGVYFVWTLPEITELLGDDATLFVEAYGVTEAGNFVDPHHPTPAGEPGMNVLHVARTAEELAKSSGRSLDDVMTALARGRETLLRHRQTRTYPGLDDKVLTSWNALMVGAMAYAGRTLDEPRYLDAAARAGKFALGEMRTDSGRLLRTYREGAARIDAFLEDYAYLADACLDLYEATFDPAWYRAAAELADDMSRRFGDEASGGWYHTASDAEELVTRVRTAFDSAIPSANGVAARVMVRLAAMTGDARYRKEAERAFRAFQPVMERQPLGTVSVLRALDRWLHEDGEIAFVGNVSDADMQRLIRPVHHAYLPGTVLALLPPGDAETEQLIPMLAGKRLVGAEEAVYVCRDFSCRAPVTTVEAVERAIAGL